MFTIKKSKIGPLHTLTITELEKLLVSVDEATWLSRGRQRALVQATTMAASVPAYRSVLARSGIDPASIDELGLESLPILDKDSYLRHFQRSDLFYGGTMAGQQWTISTTSGSSGEPYYFPRTAVQDRQYAQSAELYLRNNFKIHKRSTLYIVAFPMGAWIGGVFTYEAIRRVAESGLYNLSIITPGINKIEVIKAIQNLASDYDQVIIGSYAPFLKDIIDDGIRAGLDWKAYNLGFIFSAEGFSEVFRDYVIDRTGLEEPFHSSLNHYGTVDLGTMSHETPLAIFIRRMALARPELYQEIFGQVTKLPTLTQYLPEQFFFENKGLNLYCSAESGIPLVRYDLKDHGGIIRLTEMEAIFARFDIDLRAEAAVAGITSIWNLPFVYVYERSDFSVSYYAFQVYPQTIRHALQRATFADLVTGKFSMLVEFDADGLQQLIIHIELKSGIKESKDLDHDVNDAISAGLRHDSSEYNIVYEMYGDVVRPKLHYWEYEDETHFKPGTKQKWVKK